MDMVEVREEVMKGESFLFSFGGWDPDWVEMPDGSYSIRLCTYQGFLGFLSVKCRCLGLDQV